MTIRMFDWIALKRSASPWVGEEPPEQQKEMEIVSAAVRAAIGKLSELERCVVEQCNFEGRTYSQIADELVTSKSHVKAIHRRARRRLRKILAPFVRQRFGLEPQSGQCPICLSHYRRAAERTVSKLRPKESFGVVIRALRERFGIVIKSPKTIIGHVKYHF